MHPRPSSVYDQMKVIGSTPEAYGGAGGCGILMHICQRLLGDPQKGLLDERNHLRSLLLCACCHWRQARLIQIPCVGVPKDVRRDNSEQREYVSCVEQSPSGQRIANTRAGRGTLDNGLTVGPPAPDPHSNRPATSR